jgi:hypothetical protein
MRQGTLNEREGVDISTIGPLFEAYYIKFFPEGKKTLIPIPPTGNDWV